MTCREATEFLFDYVQDRLPTEVRGAFDEHLGRCPPCVRFLCSYRATVELAAAAGGDPTEAPSPEEPVPDALLRAILAASEAARQSPRAT